MACAGNRRDHEPVGFPRSIGHGFGPGIVGREVIPEDVRCPIVPKGVLSEVVHRRCVKHAADLLPRGVMLALMSAIGIYVLGTTIIVGLVPSEGLNKSLTPVADAARHSLGRGVWCCCRSPPWPHSCPSRTRES